jgi:hypothetical protein
MDGTAYVLDANVFIQAARRYYAFDLAPGFWQSLIDHAATGRIRSIDRVKQELLRGNDDLANWAKRDFAHAFHSTDEPDVTGAYRDVIAWVQSQAQFFDAAKAEFANVADGWLVAFAKAKGCIVVTHEVLAPGRQNNVPIPNVCQALDVPFVDTFQMLRNLGVRWAR